MIMSTTPTAAAAIQTKARTSLLVTTAVTSAARPTAANTNATISIANHSSYVPRA
ncbi:Uncharacterised protein [Mycobacteroides abscessus subsp. abscessus]|nr:Uncharacterised protein [Mycobacteroides abscessus subsp. abscessus]SLF03481.1 Uncharacterised protein [Mycobacteroides abscessus subsp. massiliense]